MTTIDDVLANFEQSAGAQWQLPVAATRADDALQLPFSRYPTLPDAARFPSRESGSSEQEKNAFPIGSALAGRFAKPAIGMAETPPDVQARERVAGRVGTLGDVPGRMAEGLEMLGKVPENLAEFGRSSLEGMEHLEQGSRHPADILNALKPAAAAQLIRMSLLGSTAELGAMGGSPGKVRGIIASLRGNPEFETEADKVFGVLADHYKENVAPAITTAKLAAQGYPVEEEMIARLAGTTTKESLNEIAERIAAEKYFRARIGNDDFELGALGGTGKSKFFNPKPRDITYFWTLVARMKGDVDRIAAAEGISPHTVRARMESPIWQRPGAKPRAQTTAPSEPAPAAMWRQLNVSPTFKRPNILSSYSAPAPIKQPTPREVLPQSRPAEPTPLPQSRPAATTREAAYQELINKGINPDVARRAIDREFRAAVPPLISVDDIYREIAPQRADEAMTQLVM